MQNGNFGNNYSQKGNNSLKNPWSLSVKQDKKKELPKKELAKNDLTFKTATQAMYYNQMLAGKSGKEFLEQFQLSQRNGAEKIIPKENSQPTNYKNSRTSNNDLRPSASSNYQIDPQPTTKRLGLSSVTSKFKNPMITNNGYSSTNYNSTTSTNSYSSSNLNSNNFNSFNNQSNDLSAECLEILADERAKNLDKNLVEKILNEIVCKKSSVNWTQIGGLTKVKEELEELVILPIQRPDIFVNLLQPCKGLLLFGPPGTGKTLIGKCIASHSDSTFFSISSSSLTSKWVGEGEKLVRALFAIARIKQPSVIFIDEIDSLLTQRSEGEHESSRRIKTEFLVQFDGISTDANENLLVIGATNLPHTLDEAARRRFTKRLYIPLPNFNARKDIITLLIKNERCDLNDKQISKLCSMTKGYSGADLAQLCKDAALNIIRRYGKKKILEIKNKDELPAITIEDFLNAILRVKPTVSESDLEVFKNWNSIYGALQNYSDDEDDLQMDTDGNESLVILN